MISSLHVRNCVELGSPSQFYFILGLRQSREARFNYMLLNLKVRVEKAESTALNGFKVRYVTSKFYITTINVLVGPNPKQVVI